ncbi:peptidyl-prolyl cis-trans isomerase [Aestuariibaculum suncheonense]|uniref:Peptidyl-prolyl cis-trans isomerase n=1 Tax=Aestuariibaculum suncheonense TaxID=1028745 RepID=A0A8J6Q8F1_9FLAO|nr:peptidylprolyl isomerase [Aestuariibaculum suncheonense]MBD0836393.1 peptidyl-prolyl cis-trans isomerase [Aestuariibaculum suncheonense]
MKNILKEPLVHFLLLGFLIFGYYYLKNKDTKLEDNSIIIDNTEYDYLLNLWKNQWQREPNEQEIKAFLDQYLRQEVFYKEALAMNLDHNDIIVKRRLSQKMEAVSNDLSAMIQPPTDEELKAFYNKNKDLFKLPPAYTFHQVLFLNDENNLDNTIKEVKDNLNKGLEIPKDRKTKLSIPNVWTSKEATDIYKTFGDYFTSVLDSLPQKKWVGPIPSGFGQHLVYLSKKELSQIANFKDIKPYIEKEYQYQTELEMQNKVFEDLMKKYQIKLTSDKIPSDIKKSYQN